jgi:hypothetical protein
MLIINGIFASLVPLLTYKAAAHLGLEKAWQRTLCAVVAGAGTAVFAYTKFITAETLSVFLPFLFLYLFTRTANVKNRAARFFLSFFTGICLAFAPAADSRLWALAAVFILTVLYSKYILGVKSMSFVGFFPAFAVFSAFQLYITEQLTGNFVVHGGGILQNAAESLTYSEQLYNFAVSTWGIGVLGVVLCFSMFIKLRKTPKNCQLPIVNYQLSVAFAFFALVYNSAMQFTGSASPLLVLFAFCYIFMYGLDFLKLLITAITLGIIFAINYTQALIPEISAVFCVIALLFVLVSCAERYRSHIITFCLSLTVIYSCLFSAIVFLPSEMRRAESENAEAVAVSASIFNSADAPPTYIINNGGLAPLLRFLNRSTVINTASHSDDLPEDCFVIFRTETGELIFEPRGERAVAFALSQE